MKYLKRNLFSGNLFSKVLFFSFYCFFSIMELSAQRAVQEPIWRQALGGAVLGAPAVQAEIVTMVCEGGTLKTYSRFGNPLWSYFARGRLSPFVSQSPEGTSYISRTNGIFMAVNRSGRELWRTNLKDPIIAPAIVGWDGRIFVSTENKIICYTASGSLLWSRTLTEKPIIGPLADKRGGIFMAFGSGELLDIDAFGRYFQRRLREAPMAVAALDLGYSEPYTLAGWEGALIREGGQGYFIVYPDGETVLIREDGGTSSFPALDLSASIRRAASRGDTAAFVLANGQLVLVNGSESRVTRTMENHVSGSEIELIYDERGVYVLGRNGASGFAEDGQQIWNIAFQETAALPAFSDDGILYTGSKDWILNAYRTEERVRTKRYFIFGPAPEGNYGTGNPPPSALSNDFLFYDDDTIQEHLKLISHTVQNGRVGGQELEYAAYLMEIIQSTGDIPGRPINTHPLVQITRRAEALRLLGAIGSRETIPFLTRIFSADRDPLIRAAAAEAIGRIGVDPEGTALRAFTVSVSPRGGVNRDDRTLTSVAAATGALCRFSGPPLSETGVRLLTLIAGANDMPQAQRTARKELGTLK
jgi:outer membrane protein assembly factor BamB